VTNTDLLSSDALIENILLQDMETFSIDEPTSTVILFMPYGYDIRALAPDFELSPWAEIQPTGGTLRDFTQAKTYTVTAEDGSTTREWTLQVHIPELTLNRSIASGWNWLSLSLHPEELGITSIMGSLSFDQLDYLKSPLHSATWYTSYGWYGDLKEFPHYLTLYHQKANAGNWEVTGREINPTLEVIPVVPGWNSIPYLLKEDVDINAAFQSTGFPSGNPILKGESGSAVYYPESGWEGDLSILQVLHGYKMKSTHYGQLYFDADAINTPLPPETSLKSQELSPLYTQLYRYSSLVLAELTDKDNSPITNKNDQLMAYNDGQLCGIANARFVEALNRYIFIMTCYGNTNSQMTLKTVHKDKEYILSDHFMFNPDDVIGEAYEPFELVLPIATLVDDVDTKFTILISPNPAETYINIQSEWNLESIVIYNTVGSMVINKKVNGSTVPLNINALANGVYFIKVTTKEHEIIRKFIKRSP
jgi:hypothetical protein